MGPGMGGGGGGERPGRPRRFGPSCNFRLSHQSRCVVHLYPPEGNQDMMYVAPSPIQQREIRSMDCDMAPRLSKPEDENLNFQISHGLTTSEAEQLLKAWGRNTLLDRKPVWSIIQETV